PNGIDRVDASFATHFLASDAPNRKAFLLTPIGPRAIRLSAARSIVEGVHTRWRESERPETDRAFLRVRSALAGGQPSPPNLLLPGESAPRRLAQTMGVLSGAALLHASAWTQMDAIGTGAVYLNVCQF